MSATALPVLAHILATSRIGALATSCAAVGDATLWCLLAINVCLVGNGSVGDTLLACFVVMAVATTALTGPLLDVLRLRTSGTEPGDAGPDRISASIGSRAA
jgi:Kef-type K+ transport system membrane component KefB